MNAAFFAFVIARAEDSDGGKIKESHKIAIYMLFRPPCSGRAHRHSVGTSAWSPIAVGLLPECLPMVAFSFVSFRFVSLNASQLVRWFPTHKVLSRTASLRFAQRELFSATG